MHVNRDEMSTRAVRVAPLAVKGSIGMLDDGPGQGESSAQIRLEWRIMTAWLGAPRPQAVTGRRQPRFVIAGPANPLPSPILMIDNDSVKW